MPFSITLGDDKIREIHNSILLSIFLLFSFSFHFVPREFKPVITIIILFISFIALFYSRIDKLRTQFQFNTAIFWIAFVLLSIIIELINSSFNPFSFYLFSAPTFAYFIAQSKFNRTILYFPFVVITTFFTYYIFSGQDLNFVFPHSSRNWISVIMLTNTAVIMIIDWKQFKKISILPPLLTFIFSLFAKGRAGIICSLVLLLGILYLDFAKFSLKKKLKYSSYIVIPAIILLFVFFDSIKEMNVLERIVDMGLKDEARYNMLHAYSLNINLKTLMLGYDITTSHVFVRNDLNPHNSFIRLHYQLGFLFFPIISYLVYTLYKLFLKNKLYFFILISLLLRGWTDSVFFHSEFDFLIVLLILSTQKSFFYD